MNSIHTVTLEVNDPETARAFYTQFGVDSFIEVRPGTAPTSGFRGYTLSLLVTQPRAVDHFAQTALDAGATSLKQRTTSGHR
ncbi:hypothetical protein [Nocardioides limicola]|uniref:hypothetical protein n=1 Tax=Nocardioides limicola TaxID=2803368 RepID=UPI00193B8CA6|nr:hypothetical protein [Nocardioides sp. DJM-14]